MELPEVTEGHTPTAEERKAAYMAQPMTQLVDRYNSLNPEKLATVKTFSKREKIVDKIIAREDILDLEGAREMHEPETQPPPVKPGQPEAPVDPKPAETAPPPRSGRIIKQVAQDLLMTVVSTNDENRKVGLSYVEILAKIKAEFPGCKTSIPCLRWYAVQMRADEFILPLRPRRESIAPVVEAA